MIRARGIQSVRSPWSVVDNGPKPTHAGSVVRHDGEEVRATRSTVHYHPQSSLLEPLASPPE
jgi:acyl transferase domain-containing protein